MAGMGCGKATWGVRSSLYLQLLPNRTGSDSSPMAALLRALMPRWATVSVAVQSLPPSPPALRVESPQLDPVTFKRMYQQPRFLRP